MLSAGVAVEGHGHGLGPGPGPGGPYLPGYPPSLQTGTPTHDWRHKQEFLRPAPKHNAITSTRYNGSSAPLNGTRLLKYSPPSNPPTLPPLSSLPPPNLSSSLSLNSSSLPVNLSAHAQQVKDEPHTPHSSSDDLPSYYPRLYPPPPGVGAFSGLYPGPYAGLYSGPYGQMVRVASAAAAVGYVPPPTLSPLEHQYSPPASATSPHASGGPSQSQGQGTFVSPATQFPSSRKDLGRDQRDRERDKRERDLERDKKVVQGFKVPSGKEGSLKHRILPRLDPPRPKHHPLTLTKHHSPNNNNNNTVIPGNFSKGSLIQLATGELRRVEDMRTEDFVLSAERSPELRLAESTVVRVCEKGEMVMVTLTYNQNRTQVEFEASVEHPFFVYGQGWASCSPERTLQHYGLKVHRLQVGDILVSLTPREPAVHAQIPSGPTYDLSRPRDTVTVTTATTTAMTARQVTRPNVSTAPAAMGTMPPPSGTTTSVSNSSTLDSLSNSRKRRWSAPDQISEEHEKLARRIKE